MKDLVLKVPRHLRRGHRANDERVSIESGVKLIAHMCKYFGLADLGAIKLLDIGCGCKFTQAILDNDLPIGEYVGVDVYAEMIAFLQSNVKDTRFSFYHMNTHNEMYNQDGDPLTANTKLPLDNKQFDVICLYSVFTHLAPPDYVAMLKLLRPYIKPDGRLLYTAFINEKTSGGLGYIDFYARNFEAFENDASAKQTQHLVEVLKKEGALAKAIENPAPPDFKDMVPTQPLKVAMYSRKHALELVERTGWEVESLNEPAEEIQHYMVCKPV